MLVDERESDARFPRQKLTHGCIGNGAAPATGSFVAVHVHELVQGGVSNGLASSSASLCNQVVSGEEEMRRLWLLPAVAIVAIVSGAQSADAAYCGAISYQGCSNCGETVVSGGAVADGGAAAGAVVADGGASAGAGSYTVTFRITV